MTIDFHAAHNRYTYASREAQPDWASVIGSILDPIGKHVVDVGCGGGIYSAAWADLGAKAVTGIDFSEQMVLTAIERNKQRPNLSFQKGDALATGLASGSADIVFERALIHHLQDHRACFAEALRVLRKSGFYIIQDRTPEDIRIPGSPEHIRGYFFECFPKLLDFELGRRPTEGEVSHLLQDVGFQALRVVTVWETRRIYKSFADLSKDLLGRTGRSILYNLTDSELMQLVDFIREKIVPDTEVIERDCWTIWSSIKS